MATETGYSRAIVHIDADAFFVSVEQVKDWRLRGKAVVTGGERGAVTSLSIEAKKLGITRGMPMFEVKRRFPSVHIVSGDYALYALFAKRMYAIVREYASSVEEYSIDECFADITLEAGAPPEVYEALAQRIQAHLTSSLGITFGVGLASSKTLAKITSKRNKPNGFTPLRSETVESVLQDIPLYDVWGLGGALSTRLRSLQVMTAYDLTQKNLAWLREHKFSQPVCDSWHELRGQSVLPIGSSVSLPKSIMKTRTFPKASMEESYIRAQLAKNLEIACEKLRHKKLSAGAVSFFLKTSEFSYHGAHISFVSPLTTAPPMLEKIYEQFHKAYADGIRYRASGITLRSLIPTSHTARALFGEMQESVALTKAHAALDALNDKFGGSCVFLGESMSARTHDARDTKVDALLRVRHRHRKMLALPFLGTAS